MGSEEVKEGSEEVKEGSADDDDYSPMKILEEESVYLTIVNETTYDFILRTKNKTDSQYLLLDTAVESLQLEMSELNKAIMLMSSVVEEMNNTLLGKSEAPCEVWVGKTCYWADVHMTRDINFQKGVNICEKRNSVIVQIPNLDVYMKVMANLRSKMTTSKAIAAWIGMTIDPLTGNVTFPSATAFTLWHPRRPHKGPRYSTWQNIFLYVQERVNSPQQGMANRYPVQGMEGIVCQAIFQ